MGDVVSLPHVVRGLSGQATKSKSVRNTQSEKAEATQTEVNHGCKARISEQCYERRVSKGSLYSTNPPRIAMKS